MPTDQSLRLAFARPRLRPPPASRSEPPSHPQPASARRRPDCGRGERPVADPIGSRRPSGEASPSVRKRHGSSGRRRLRSRRSCGRHVHLRPLVCPWLRFFSPSPCPSRFAVPGSLVHVRRRVGDALDLVGLDLSWGESRFGRGGFLWWREELFVGL